MLVKSSDDKSSRVKLLESLLDRPLSDMQKKWVNEQLWALRTGLQGEKDAAYYIDSIYRDSPFTAVLHDFRIEIDGETAQIDHLIISHLFAILFETKNFNGNIRINDYGEFSVRYASGKEIGIPSPLEQSKRHERILVKLFDQLGIKSLTGKPMRIRHAVLVSPKSIITRPDGKVFDTFPILKADSLAVWKDDFLEKETSALKIVSLFGEMVQNPASFLKMTDKAMQEHTAKIVKLLLPCHCPENLLSLPEFLNCEQKQESSPVEAVASVDDKKIAEPLCSVCQQPISPAEKRYCLSHSDKFLNQLLCRQHQKSFIEEYEKQQKEQSEHVSVEPDPVEAPQTQAYYCDYTDCGSQLSDSVVDYCRKNADWFGHKLYCFKHQKAIASFRKKKT